MEALRCAFRGAGLILEERTKGGSVRVHYSEKKQGTVYALQYCMRWRCVCPAVLYEVLALLTGYCIEYTVSCIS